jgi:hypothetical protein
MLYPLENTHTIKHRRLDAYPSFATFQGTIGLGNNNFDIERSKYIKILKESGFIDFFSYAKR